jgi:predicted RNA-binding protein with PUA-like domain
MFCRFASRLLTFSATKHLAHRDRTKIESGRMPPKKLAANKRQFWLFKSEPEVYSIQDLAKEKRRTTFWDGVRNYQARNLLRDSIKVGDGVFFYHSSVDPMAIVGTATVVRAGYPDHTAFDPKSCHFDPKSNATKPTWFMVDIQLDRIFPEPLTRAKLNACPELKKMVLLQRGSRLSIQPVTDSEWDAILRLAKSAS